VAANVCAFAIIRNLARRPILISVLCSLAKGAAFFYNQIQTILKLNYKYLSNVKTSNT
jgi:hypothetical protein